MHKHQAMSRNTTAKMSSGKCLEMWRKVGTSDLLPRGEHPQCDKSHGAISCRRPQP